MEEKTTNDTIIYDDMFCIDNLMLFELDRFDYIKIKQEQKDLIKFNNENNSNIKSTVMIEYTDLESEYLLNLPQYKYVPFKLDKMVHIYDGEIFFIFNNKKENERYAHRYGLENEVFKLVS